MSPARCLLVAIASGAITLLTACSGSTPSGETTAPAANGAGGASAAPVANPEAPSASSAAAQDAAASADASVASASSGDAGAATASTQTAASPPAPTEPNLALGEELRPLVGGMPAIAPDGATIAVADIANDGLRGAPNLTLRLFDARTGAARPAVTVLSVREGVRALDGNPATIASLRRAAEPRLARAQAAVRGYRPLTPMVFPAQSNLDAPVDATAGSLRLTFTPASGELLVRDAAGATVARQVLAPARATGARRRPECVQNPSLVRAAWVDAAAGLLLVHNEYSGTDSCVAPDATWRVVRLNAQPAAPAPTPSR